MDTTETTPIEDLSQRLDGGGLPVPRQSPHAELVLSLFPGIDLLGRGFQLEGFCVVRGPDTLWDDRIETWSGTPHAFAGVIGGPPCQNFSDANRCRDTAEGVRLLQEFLRVVMECRPAWWLCENVRNVPDIALRGYTVQRLPLTDLECGGRQRRLRHIQFGTLTGEIIRPERAKSNRPVTAYSTVLCTPNYPSERVGRRAASQGVPGLRLAALTKRARSRAIGNAVPLHMARVLAKAVSRRSHPTEADCCCGCGRAVTPPARHATAACRKRMERRRRGHSSSVTWPIDESPTTAPNERSSHVQAEEA